MLRLSWDAALRRRRASTRKLRGAGFDEDDVIRRRDKAGLIGHIARPEPEIYDHQHSLGLTLLEQKELTSKYEQLKASSEATEIMLKRQLASQQSSLADTRKRGKNLKRKLAIRKERISNLERALHDMYGETVEVKVSYEAKLAEALQMIEMAQKKFNEAEEKLLAAKSLEAESIRTRDASLKSQLETASKEKEINLLGKSLDDTQKKLHEKEQSLLKEQVLLNQRVENILERLGYVTQSEKRLEEEKLNLKDERKVLLEEKNKLVLNMQAIISREEAEIERLHNRRQEFDTEMDIKLASCEEEIDVRKTLLDQRETAINEQEDAVVQREQNLNLRLAELAIKEESLVKKSDELREEEKRISCEMDIKLASFEEEIDARKTLLDQRETAINEQEDAVAQREQNLNLRLAELANKEESLVKKSDELREEEKRLSCEKLKNGGVENMEENGVHMFPGEDKNAGPKHSIVKKLEFSPVFTPIFLVRKFAQVIFKCSLEKAVDPHNDGLVPAKLANVSDSSLAAAYSDGHELENGAGKVPQTKDGLKVGKKRLNNVLSHGESEILQPKRKQQRSTTQTFRVIGGEIDSNCSSSVLEEKCSKNEHDAFLVGLCGKGPRNPQEGKLASCNDVPEGGEHSEDISVPVAEPSNRNRMVDSEDKGEPEEKTSSATKIWRFLIT